MIKVLHLITSLGCGGAERVLNDLVTHADSSGEIQHLIVSIKDLGFYGQSLQDKQIKVYTLNVTKFCLWKLFGLYKILKKENPDIVQTWLYHADFIGLIFAKLAGVKHLVWNIRSTQLNFKTSSWHSVILRKLCAILSFIPDKIVNCSEVSIAEHVRVGYKSRKFVCIPNGYDLDKYFPDDKLAVFTDSKPILGFVGRNDPQKDIFNFLNALLILKAKNILFHALIVGHNTNSQEVSDFLLKYELSNVTLLGQRSDIVNIYNSLDLLVLSSMSEGFPNVVAEAMSCGTPCVVTNVGDAGFIVGDTGIVVSPCDKVALSNGIMQMLMLGADGLASRSKLARARIEELFSLQVMINGYSKLYLELLDK